MTEPDSSNAADGLPLATGPELYLDPDAFAEPSEDRNFDRGYDSGELVAQESSDRRALRRVAGLSTELVDVTEVEYRQLRLERVVLVGVWTSGTLIEAENSLRELARLAETAGSEVLDGLIQRRDKPDAATYIGSGKAKEVPTPSWLPPLTR